MDACLFTSPSTVKTFIEFADAYYLEKTKKETLAVAIGLTTATELKKQGFQHVIYPQKYTIEAMVEQLVAYLQNERTKKRMTVNEFDRHRRLRKSATLRSLVRETKLNTSDLVYPLFIVEGETIKSEVSSMPGVFQISLDYLDEEIDELLTLGIPAVLLFGIPKEKDEVGSGAYDPHGIVQKAIRQIKQKKQINY